MFITGYSYNDTHLAIQSPSIDQPTRPLPSAPPMYQLFDDANPSTPPPSYETVVSEKETEATNNWKNLTANCKLNRTLTRITLIAAIILSAAAIAGGIILCVTGVGLIPGLILATAGFIGLQWSPIGLLVHLKGTNRYEDKTVAQGIVDKIKKCDINDSILNDYNLTKYGFISQTNIQELQKIRTQFFSQRLILVEKDALEERFKDYVRINVIPNLPNPSSV